MSHRRPLGPQASSLPRNLGSQASSLLLLSLFILAPCLAADDDAVQKEANSGANIFSSPDDKTVPSFTEARGGEGRIRKALMNRQKDDIPDFRQIRMIPSLTPQQRKEIKEIYTSNKEKFGDMLAEGKKMRDKFGAGEDKKAAVMADPEARAKMQKLRAQVREMRTRTWEQVKVKLTEQQLSELEQMRKGTLQPATFNEPMTSTSPRGTR